MESRITTDDPLLAASLCSLGLFQFSRAFKRERGMTFQEYITRSRIRQAATLLRHLYAPVTDVGFNDLSHFSRTFRRYVGIRPSEYRHGTWPPAPPCWRWSGQGGDAEADRRPSTSAT